LTATIADTYRLAEKRYNSGIDSYLAVLDAQRSHFAARQSLVTLRFAKLAAQIQLYAALGGGADYF
jgi:multidrug efflux system outer membrane protein